MALMAALLPDFLPDTLIALFTGIGLGGGFATWFYEKIRIQAVNRENDSLKRRVGDLPKATKHSTLTHKQLKARTLNLSKDIQAFLKEEEKTTKTQEQQSQHKIQIINSLEVSEFRQKFYPEALNLRSEIQERLPPYAHNHGFSLIFFEDPFSVDYIKELANELDRLAAALPTKKERL
jgi:hypothetical protein